MANRFFVVVGLLILVTGVVIGQSKPSIQGVWKPVEVTITNPNAASGGLGKGTHTNLQPALVIFTGKHYSQVLDTSGKPRPTTGFNVAGKPTATEMESQWTQFAASSGTYELSGTTLTTRAIVSKNPRLQGKSFTRYTIKLDGDNLWTTQVENSDGKVANPNTIKYVRVE